MPKSDRDILANYLPKTTIDTVLNLIKENQINLNIKHSRSTKLGDFRPPQQGKPASLSINADLNPYAFLITLIHEIAHWMVWKNNNNYKNLQPHGIEWKRTFQGLMYPFLNDQVFPNKLLKILQKHMQNPKASSTSDIPLTKAIREYNTNRNNTILADMEIGSLFYFKNRQFKVIKKNRSRYQCKDLGSDKQYLIHSLAEINPL